MKTSTQAMVEKLNAIGGNEWIKGDYHRVYFNNLADLLGLEIVRYKTGNISSAGWEHGPLSNRKARDIEYNLDFGKFWYDVKEAKFMSKNLENRDFNLFDMLIEAIENKIQ